MIYHNSKNNIIIETAVHFPRAKKRFFHKRRDDEASWKGNRNIFDLNDERGGGGKE